MSESDQQLSQLINGLNDEDKQKLLAQLSGTKSTQRPEVNVGRGLSGQSISPDEIMNFAMNQFMGKMDAASGGRGTSSLENQIAEKDSQLALMRQLLQDKVNEKTKAPSPSDIDPKDLSALLEQQNNNESSDDTTNSEADESMDTEESTDTTNDDDKDESSTDDKQPDDPEVYSRSEIEKMRETQKQLVEKLKESEAQKEELEKNIAKTNQTLRLLSEVDKDEEAIQRVTERAEKKRAKLLEKIKKANQLIDPVYMKDESKQTQNYGKDLKSQLNDVLLKIAQSDANNDLDDLEKLKEKDSLIKDSESIVRTVMTAASAKIAMQGKLSAQEREIQKLKKQLESRREGSARSYETKGKSANKSSSYSSGPLSSSKCIDEINCARNVFEQKNSKGLPMDKKSIEKGVKRKAQEYVTFAAATWNKHPKKIYPKGFYPFADTVMPEIKYGEDDHFGWKRNGCPSPREVLGKEALNMAGGIYEVLDDEQGLPPIIPKVHDRLLNDMELRGFGGNIFSRNAPGVRV